MGKKPIVSATYENERISVKKKNNSLPYLKCVLRLSCVVHGPIYGGFMGFYVNGSLYKGLSFTHQCRCSPMLIFRAWATCGGSTTNFDNVMLSSLRGQTHKNLRSICFLQ